MVGIDGDADGDGDPDRALALERDGGLPHRGAEPLGDGGPAPRVGLRQDQHKLLAALPEREVHLPDLRPDPPGELDQHGVPGGVPVCVVDLLEPVQVQGEHGQRAAEPAGPLHLPAHRLLQVPVVPQPGQRVGQRQPLRLLVHPDVVHGHRRLPGEGAQRGQVGVVELVAAEPVVQDQHAAGGRRRAEHGRRAPARCVADGLGRPGRRGERHGHVGDAARLVWGERVAAGLDPPAARLAGRGHPADDPLTQGYPQLPGVRAPRLVGVLGDRGGGHRQRVDRPPLRQALGGLADQGARGRLQQQHRAGPGTGRGERGLQDHLEDPVQVVGAGQRVAEHGEVPAQLVPAGGQRRHVGLHLPGHPVERAAQPAQLVRRADRDPGGQVAGRHPVGGGDQFGQRPGRAARQPPGDQHGQRRGQQDRRGQPRVQRARAVPPDGEDQRQGLVGAGSGAAQVPARDVADHVHGQRRARPGDPVPVRSALGAQHAVPAGGQRHGGATRAGQAGDEGLVDGLDRVDGALRRPGRVPQVEAGGERPRGLATGLGAGAVGPATRGRLRGERDRGTVRVLDAHRGGQAPVHHGSGGGLRPGRPGQRGDRLGRRAQPLADRAHRRPGRRGRQVQPVEQAVPAHRRRRGADEHRAEQHGSQDHRQERGGQPRAQGHWSSPGPP